MVNGAAPAALTSVQFLNFTRATVALGEALGVALGSTGAGLETAVAVGVGVGLVATVTPLFQVSFAPDLVQVYFFPATVWVSPALAHFEPGFGAEAEVAGAVPAIRRVTTASAVSFDLLIE